MKESDILGFRAAWLDYCRCFNATTAEKTARYGTGFKVGPVQGHSRLDAYAAHLAGEAAPAARARRNFTPSDACPAASTPWTTTRIDGPTVLNAGSDPPWVSINSTAL